jgi:hypothetical protein
MSYFRVTISLDVEANSPAEAVRMVEPIVQKVDAETFSLNVKGAYWQSAYHPVKPTARGIRARTKAHKADPRNVSERERDNGRLFRG